MAQLQSIVPCLWFDDQAETAARFYCSVFPNAALTAITRYPDAGQEIHHRPAGSVMTVAFELDGQAFTALNGGPAFKLNEAISLQLCCDTQQEIDYFWEALGQDGPVESQQCGWLKDRFGLSWQVVPRRLPELMADPTRAPRVMQALLQMKKLDIAGLEQA
ncbi:VOC family protein [Gallaecimonas kandeliae]|uniref:VOC family protein n=1 Tax=Gallaecimonas kandeliae TaxID=3029055 RepID=UPI00264A1076|nr:VOC family protein [Gallaecimonas kandeliae]WKE66391.1 VOC family protein [Gallaecimonas kandeliae]